MNFDVSSTNGSLENRIDGRTRHDARTYLKMRIGASREHYRYAASASSRKGRGPLGSAGGLRGGKKEKKRKKMMKGSEREML